jgi:DegV family protein with EDD domain
MIQLFADTLSSIPTKEALALGLKYLPQLIIFGDKTYRDDTEISPTEFIEKLASSKLMPKTAAPQPALYNPYFDALRKTKDTAIVICPSAKVSGTVRSVETAAQDYKDLDIRLIDTGLIAAPLGVIVYEAVKWVKEGLPAEKVVRNINELMARARTFFVVDTLEFLYRGGRIGLATNLIGSIIDMKPILVFRNGQVEPFEKQRTKKKALQRIVEICLGECPHSDDAHLSLSHGGNEQEANAMASDLQNQLGIKKSWVCFAPPAVLVHTGPGVIGITYFVK